VYQDAEDCSIALVCRFFPGSCITLSGSVITAARSFRDDVLAKSPRGKAYTDLYYKFSSEAVQIMMFNPMLMLHSRETIERYKPVIESMVKGEQVTLTPGDLAEIDGFLNSIAAKGGPQLQEAVKQVCEDLRDPQVHAEFGITLTEGPKREMPTHHPLQPINRAGGAALFLGFFIAFGYCLIRTRKPGAKAMRCAPLLFIGSFRPASGRLRRSPAGDRESGGRQKRP
jgi:hypothetical protein